MAAGLKSRTNLFYRICIGIKNSNTFTNCTKRSYSSRTFPIVVRSGTVESPFSSTSCGSLMSTEAAQSIPDANINPINIAVCIERVPIITPSKSDLEVQYEELQECLEFEHSSLSEYELIQATMTQKREQLQRDEDNEELKKEVAALDSEYQELREIEEQHIKDITLASRTTEADLSNSSSPHRRLELSLFLLTPDKEDPERWQMPQGNVNSGETLREAAERIARECVHGDIVLRFMSNAPSGIYRRPEKDGVKPDSPKVFFYHAQLLGTVHKYSDNIWLNCIWASKDELSDYLPLNYYQSVSRFIL